MRLTRKASGDGGEISVECTSCGHELVHYDSYGLFASHQSGEKFGDIYRCPNEEGFETEAEAREYEPEHEGDWDEIVCLSSTHNGSFYTDKGGTLYEGYPC